MRIKTSNIKRFIFKYFSKIFIPIFFDKKYLKGKYFEENNLGWVWAWKAVIFQKVFRVNSHIPWPVTHASVYGDYKKIKFHIEDINNFQSIGCYFQTMGGEITIGKGSLIAPNVGIITANHDAKNLSEHTKGADVVIGDNCWIGMNSILLPGVVLGDYTIVGAGSVVTKSFEEGHQVIAGNPAKVVKKL